MESHASLKTFPFFLALFLGFGLNQLPVLLAAMGAFALFSSLRSEVFAFIKNQLGPLPEHYANHKNLFQSMAVEFPLIWAIGLLFAFLQKQVWAPDFLETYHPLWLFAVTVAALPLVEEILFRAEMQGFFIKTFGAQWALVATSLSFAIIHPQNVLGYILLGYVLSVYAFKSQKLWISFIVSTCYHLCNFAFWWVSQRTPIDIQSQGRLTFGVATVALSISFVAYFLTRKHINYVTVFKIEDSEAQKVPLFQQPAAHLFGFALLLLIFACVDSKFGGSVLVEKLTGAPFSRNLGETVEPPPTLHMDFSAVVPGTYDKKTDGYISKLSLQTCDGQWQETMLCRERLLILNKKNPTHVSRERLEQVEQWVNQKLADQVALSTMGPDASFQADSNEPACDLKVFRRAKRNFKYIDNEWVSHDDGERRLNEVAKTFRMPDDNGKPKYMSVVSLNVIRQTVLSRKQWKMEKRQPASKNVIYSENNYHRRELIEGYSMNSGESDREYSSTSIPPEFLKGCGAIRISFINE